MNDTLDKKPKTWYNILVNVIINVILVIVIAILALVIFITPVNIKGNSMLNTVKDGQVVATTRIKPSSFNKGDLVIAQMNFPSPTTVIKRVVATEGDVIAFVRESDNIDLYFYINNEWVKKQENYIFEPMTYNSYFASTFIRNYIYPDVNSITNPLVLGKDEYFLMGDNRNHSSDSRAVGVIKEQDISAKVLFNISENPFMNFIFNIIYPFSKGETQ